jgi:large subunit ribosomal protein L24
MAQSAKAPSGKAATAKPRRMKIRKGDKVIVIAGKDRGREGTVIAVRPDRQRVLVQGVNLIRKNTKVTYQGQRGAKEGGIVTQEALIHVSNVSLIDPDSKKPSKAGFRSEGDKKIRVSRSSGKDV